MTHDEKIEATCNVLAQYKCKHLSWGTAVWELADAGIPAEAITILLDYEDL